MLGGQQYGLMPGGGVRNPGLLSATCPGGQHSLGLLFSRACGQQIESVPGLTPMSPARIGIAHFVPAGQQRCVSPVTQHERLFGQHPALPQQRDVLLSQHFLSHSSWFLRQRLQRPIFSLAQFHVGGQHLLLPHHAWPCGQRLSHTRSEPVPIRTVVHSSLGLQHRGPQPRSPCLQQSCCSEFAQNSSSLQHLTSDGQGSRHGFFLHPAPSATVPHQHLYSSAGLQQIRWQMAPLQLHSHSNPPCFLHRWKPAAARAFVVAIPGTAAATSAPPSTRSTRVRDMGRAMSRASESRNVATL
jgi:hypothetical protein